MSAPPTHAPQTAGRPEIWLRTNARALLVGLGFVVFLMSAGLSAILISSRSPYGVWLSIGGWIVLVVGGYLIFSLLYQLSLPRLAYDGDGSLLVYLQSARPLQIPIEVVEFFFVGQGTSFVPATVEGPSKSRTIVVRLAEAATQWHNLPINTAQGEGREAYVILRGTWCEPITPELVKRLNHRLVEVQRARRPTQEPTT